VPTSRRTRILGEGGTVAISGGVKHEFAGHVESNAVELRNLTHEVSIMDFSSVVDAFILRNSSTK
jgi:hypothetical protein